MRNLLSYCSSKFQSLSFHPSLFLLLLLYSTPAFSVFLTLSLLAVTKFNSKGKPHTNLFNVLKKYTFKSKIISGWSLTTSYSPKMDNSGILNLLTWTATVSPELVQRNVWMGILRLTTTAKMTLSWEIRKDWCPIALQPSLLFFEFYEIHINTFEILECFLM